MKLNDFKIGDIVLWSENTGKGGYYFNISKVKNIQTYSVEIDYIYKNTIKDLGHFFTQARIDSKCFNIISIEKSDILLDDIKLKYPEYFI